jgi:hypothetical protein
MLQRCNLSHELRIDIKEHIVCGSSLPRHLRNVHHLPSSPNGASMPLTISVLRVSRLSTDMLAPKDWQQQQAAAGSQSPRNA